MQQFSNSAFGQDIVRVIDGTALVPSVAFRDAATTGLFRPTGTLGGLGFTVGGVERARFTSTGTLSLGVPTNVGGGVGTLWMIGAAVAGGGVQLSVTPGAHTAVIAESIDNSFMTHTITITGAYSSQRFTNFDRSFVTAASGLTLTTAATVTIACPPSVLGSAIITGAYALQLMTAGYTVAGAAGTTAAGIRLLAHTVTTNTATSITSVPGISQISIGQMAVAQSGGAVSFTNTNMLFLAGAPTVGSGITTTNLNAIRIQGNSTYNGSAAAAFAMISIASSTLTTTTVTQVTAVPGASLLSLGQLTIAQSGGAVTYDSAATLYILNAPTVGGSVTLTNTYAIWVDNGQVRLDGQLGIADVPGTFTHTLWNPSFTAVGGIGAIIRLGGNLTAAAGANGTGLRIAPTITEAGSGNHPILAALYVEILAVTGGAATVTDTAGVYIQGPSTATVSGGNWSLWVDAGPARFDGPGIFGATVATLTNGNALFNTGFVIAADSSNNLFSAASAGAGSTAMYIGNALITTVSDVRLKRNITATERNALEIFRKLRVVDFAWDDPADRAEVNRNSRGRWTGLLAQETVDVVPWIINAPDRNCKACRSGAKCEVHDTYWLVDYQHMVPLLVKGFQEVDSEIVSLKKRIGELETEVKSLRRA